MSSIDQVGIQIALTQARKSFNEGGIPIGCSLLSVNGAILGAGHNQRIQKSSPTLHGEIAALEDAGRLKAGVYRDATIYTTLSPCSMCTGAILLYKIPRVVIGENKTFSMGGEDLLRSHGVEVVVLDNEECKELMAKFISEKPEEWNEDIGEE
ncbi:cytidine deaminase-like protein [Lentinula edodes]|uniref:Cytosine deaminase n=1 Tax=Lentinula lateritia TaxID=40482 RepID=A0A9W8ZXR9_9AGAR|nr:cytidine deaminase-like protein [Lentinula edodes]KAJ4469719.1 cytosine deaminase [Lentinula edodes]